MPEYHALYYDRLGYFRTMLEMAADWLGVEADREIEDQAASRLSSRSPCLPAATWRTS